MGEIDNLVMGAFGEESEDVLHYLVHKVKKAEQLLWALGVIR